MNSGKSRIGFYLLAIGFCLSPSAPAQGSPELEVTERAKLAITRSRFLERVFLQKDRDGLRYTHLLPQPTGQEVPQKGMRVSNLEIGLNRRIPGQFELRINFSIDPGDLAITQPTHYRIGYKQDLSDAEWRPFEGFFFFHLLPFPPEALTIYGTRIIYFQARADIQGRMARDIQSHRSQIAFDNLTINAPPGSVEYKLEGAELKSMLAFADGKGFPLRTRLVSVTQSQCGQIDFTRSSLNFDITGGSVSVQIWQKVVEVNFLELSTKRFTPRWHVKKISVGDTSDLGPEYSRTFSGEADGDGYRLTITMSHGPVTGSGGINACLSAYFPLRYITLEGPKDDIVLDSAAPWKNAFPPN